MKKVNLLSNAEMRKVMGGYLNPAKCSASCGDRVDAECGGESCQAVDGVGCTNSDGTQVLCSNQPKKDN